LSEWDELIPDTEFNTFENASMKQTPFFLLYGVHPRDGVSISGTSTNEGAEQFRQNRELNRQLAADHLKLARAKMAQYYDKRHLPPPKLKVGDEVFVEVAKGTAPGYKLPAATVFDVIKLGPYPIEARVSGLAYKVKLHPDMKMHPTISITRLEPEPADEYQRTRPFHLRRQLR